MSRLAIKHKYCAEYRPFDAVKYALEDCWQTYREDGYTPEEAMREDMSEV